MGASRPPGRLLPMLTGRTDDGASTDVFGWIANRRPVPTISLVAPIEGSKSIDIGPLLPKDAGIDRA